MATATDAAVAVVTSGPSGVAPPPHHSRVRSTDDVFAKVEKKLKEKDMEHWRRMRSQWGSVKFETPPLHRSGTAPLQQPYHARYHSLADVQDLCRRVKSMDKLPSAASTPSDSPRRSSTDLGRTSSPAGVGKLDLARLERANHHRSHDGSKANSSTDMESSPQHSARSVSRISVSDAKLLTTASLYEMVTSEGEQPAGTSRPSVRTLRPELETGAEKPRGCGCTLM